MSKPRTNKGNRRYKGSGGDLKKYAARYLRDRLKGFDKDMKICLAGIPRNSRKQKTHAYFPALMNCCGMLDLFGSLYFGNAKTCNIQWVFDYCNRYLPQPDYSNDNVTLLYEVLRHPTAHMSTGAGVRRPRHGTHKGQRITWKVYVVARYPAIRLEQDNDILNEQSPWDSPHDYRLHVHLKGLQRNIRESVLRRKGYLSELISSKALMRKFEACMVDVYPK